MSGGEDEGERGGSSRRDFSSSRNEGFVRACQITGKLAQEQGFGSSSNEGLVRACQLTAQQLLNCTRYIEVDFPDVGAAGGWQDLGVGCWLQLACSLHPVVFVPCLITCTRPPGDRGGRDEEGWGQPMVKGGTLRQCRLILY